MNEIQATFQLHCPFLIFSERVINISNSLSFGADFSSLSCFIQQVDKQCGFSRVSPMAGDCYKQPLLSDTVSVAVCISASAVHVSAEQKSLAADSCIQQSRATSPTALYQLLVALLSSQVLFCAQILQAVISAIVVVAMLPYCPALMPICYDTIRYDTIYYLH